MSGPGPLDLAGAALVAVLLAGAIMMAVLVEWRARRGPRPWSALDVGLAFLALLWVSATLVTAAWRLSTGSWFPPADPPVLPALLATAAGGLASTAVVLRRAGWAGAGFGPVPWRWVGRAVGCVVPFLGLSVGWVLLLERLGMPVDEQEILGLIRDGPDGLIVAVSVAYGALAAPVFEELLFRGFAIPPLARHIGAGPAILLTAVIFGGLHGSDPAAVVPLTALGVALGWLRVRSGSLWPPLALHVVNNVVAIAIALLA